jgi:hypothetical protein
MPFGCRLIGTAEAGRARERERATCDVVRARSRIKPMVDLDSSPDPVIEFYKQGIDLSLIRENLRKSPAERLLAHQQMLEFVEEVRAAGEAMRRESR